MTRIEPRPLWRCPECGREFRHRNQWHSCVVVSVDSHFEGRPPWMRQALDEMVCRLEQAAGPVRTDAVKGTIALAAGARFAEIALGARSMRVGFLLRRIETDPRLERTVDAGRWAMHTIVLDRLEDVDDQVIGWLAEAYACKL